MFTPPCETPGCVGTALEDERVCAVCHDRNGYPEGWSRSRDDAWLDYAEVEEIRNIPIPGPGCNRHPVTPRPDMCLPCYRIIAGRNEEKPNYAEGGRSQ